MANELITDFLRGSQFVVAGSVGQAGTANVRIVSPSANVGTFKISEILHGPSVLRGFAGKEITVMFDESKPIRAGESMVLFAKSWLYGDNLAVIEVGRMDEMEPDKTHTDIADAQRAVADEKLSRRIALAELVITGKVDKTEPASEEISRRMPITEHMPEYWVAEIAIKSVEKGRHEGKRVSIYFPASHDVTWHRAPKFTPGQEGIWILQRDQQEMGWRSMRLPGLTALAPLDFHALEHLTRIRNLIRSSSNSKP